MKKATTNLTTWIAPGTIMARRPAPLRLKQENLERHLSILGGTGNGKSKLLELMIRQIISRGDGLTLIDPHGDLCQAVLEYLAANEVDPDRFIYIEPGNADYCVSFDPFEHFPVDASPMAQESWLRTTVDRIVRAMLRNIALADQEMMKRLKRWLKNTLTAAGTLFDGRRLGISDALILLDPSRPEFAPIMDRLAPLLPSDVAADYRMLAETKSGLQREKWTESTMNCWRDFLVPMIKLILGQHARSLNTKEVILQRKILLVNLRKSDYLSRDQANIIGGLLINFLINAAECIGEKRPYEDRVPHFLVIDEAEHFIGEDLRMGFAELRKFRLMLCPAVQDLSCLRKGELDLSNKLISQAGLVITFQQQSHDDAEYLGKAFAYGNLDFREHLREEIRPDGYDWVPTQSLAINVNRGLTESKSATITRTASTTEQVQSGENINEMVSIALSASHADGQSEGDSDGWSLSRTLSGSRSRTVGNANTEGESETHSSAATEQHGKSNTRSHAIGGSISTDPRRESLTHNDGQADSDTLSDSLTNGLSLGSQRSRTNTESQTDGVTHGIGVTTNGSATKTNSNTDTAGVTVSNGHSAGSSSSRSHATALAEGQGATLGSAQSQGQGVAVSFQLTPLARTKLVSVPSGSLERSVENQVYSVINQIAALPPQVVMVRCRGLGMPFLLRVHDIVDPYEERGMTRSPAWRLAARRELIARMRERHSCFFDMPKVSEREMERQRVARFLGVESTATVESYANEQAAAGVATPNANALAPATPSNPYGM